MIPRGRADEPMPILFASQLVGLALGLDPGALGLNRHFVSPARLVTRLRAPAALPDVASPFTTAANALGGIAR